MQSRDALALAFATGSLMVALPLLAEQARTLLRDHADLGPRDAELPDMIIPAVFNFPHSGKLLSIGFVLFAGWFTGASISPVHYPALAATGVLVLFGSVNVAVPFLLDMFRIPADTFQLYLATGVVSARFGTHARGRPYPGDRHHRRLRRRRRAACQSAKADAVRDRHACACRRRDRRNPAPGRPLRRPAVPEEQAPLGHAGDARPRRGDGLSRGRAAPRAAAGSVLDRVRERGRLRVGYFADSLPYAFTNDAGDLVGFDVDMALQLARDLGVQLELVPWTIGGLQGVDPRHVIW